MKLVSQPPSQSRAVVIGAGTMGPDVAAVLARAGSHVTVIDPNEQKRQALPGSRAVPSRAAPRRARNGKRGVSTS